MTFFHTDVLIERHFVMVALMLVQHPKHLPLVV